ncbi:MAG: hypothetical protein INR73_14770 [Williamsia sp.]|nr:hypothetical protein [Williamsia sp.]
MKKLIQKWIIRLTATFVLMAVLLVVIVLNPALTYASKTRHNNFTIFHNQPLDPALILHLRQATQWVSNSEYYDPHWNIDICLNDGSRYPSFVEKTGGPAFGRGFYNKVVLMGAADYKGNSVMLNGYRWNLQQLLAHEMIHCFQLHQRGVWKSKPLASIPDWKWEGYAEWVSRRTVDQADLRQNTERLLQAEKTAHDGWIQFSDGTGSPVLYYKYRLLVQYCMEIRKMKYDEVLDSEAPQEVVWEQLMNWFDKQ